MILEATKLKFQFNLKLTSYGYGQVLPRHVFLFVK